MLILRGGETDGQRAARMGGRLWYRTPPAALRELERARRWLHYRRGLALELLQDFERYHDLPPDRSEQAIAAAAILLPVFVPAAGAVNALTPPQIIQSRTCQLWFRCDLEATQGELLANLNPAPNLVIRGFLTQRFSLRVEIDSIGTGALGSTTLKISFDGSTNWAITGYVTTATMTELAENGHQTGIWLSCAAGPYDAGNIWVSRLASIADQSGHGNRDLINFGNNVGTMFDYVASSSVIKNRPYMASDATRATYLSSLYTPPDPGTTPSFVTWVGNAAGFVNTGRIWGTGTVNQFCVRQADPTPACALAGGVAVLSNTQMVVGTWLGCEAAVFDSTADRLKFGSNASLTPAPAGGCQSGVPNSGVTLGARANTGALPSTYEFADFAWFTGGEPTPTELEQSRRYKFLLYGVAA